MSKDLTERQREVLSLLCEHGHSKGVAAELGIAPKTVDLVVRAAMRRMGVKTRILAVAKWVRQEVTQ
jgi:DNA-binding NarL/FixJ family response regulator